jgi:diguanylate cyclase (GGDEF)-like protein
LLDSPIRVGGKLRGLVCFEHTGEKREWHDDEIRFSGEIADQFLQVLTNAERIKSEEHIRRLAFYDPLTGLPNRRLLLEGIQHELEVVRRQRLYGSLLFLDLDNFKTLNDSLGHHVGDELLVQLAERLRSGLRKEDTAARLGGDEFVVLITGEYASREMAIRQALNVASKIQTAIGGNYQLHGYEHTITTSIGITLFPEDHETAADVLKQADTAMYRAKEEGRNTIAFYNPEMQKAADRRLSLEKELRASIAEKRFEIFFQPQLDSDGQLTGAEALVRWLHPDKGLVLPADFIPVAEETGLILELGEWILKETCACIKGCSVSHVAVNISPRQFRQANFVDKVVGILQETGANPRELMIELTEGIVIENIDDTIDKMNALKRMGIRIAIDDFGTGYSSLAYLKQLPLDQLKINDKFVRDIETDPSDAVIVETIISMARHLGLSVVAEGVETADQFAFLEDKGCHLFQGFYFSRPLSRNDFREYRRSLLTT